MRWLVLAVLLPAAAQAFEGAPSLGVHAGMTGAIDGGAAPSFELAAGLPIRSRFGLDAAIGAWTLSDPARGSATEVTAAFGPSMSGALSENLSWKVTAGPAIMLTDSALSTDGFRGGLEVAPGLQLATRRRTLALDLGARTFVFGDGVRFGVVAGASYTFR